jgi:hypothetical protein
VYRKMQQNPIQNGRKRQTGFSSHASIAASFTSQTGSRYAESFTATAQPLTPFSGVKMRNFLASGQINGQFSLIEGIMVSGGAANRYRVREGA